MQVIYTPYQQLTIYGCWLIAQLRQPHNLDEEGVTVGGSAWIHSFYMTYMGWGCGLTAPTTVLADISVMWAD